MFQQNATSDEVSVTYSYIINHPKFSGVRQASFYYALEFCRSGIEQGVVGVLVSVP